MKLSIASVLLATLAMASPAHADLGGAPVLPLPQGSSPGLNRMAAVPVARVQATSPNGTVAREYLTTSGEVFAIAWSGPFQPDLRTLMGDAFFARYTQAIQDAHAHGVLMHGQMLLATPDLVVQAHGHVRAFTGLAYVPGLMPAGVTPQQLL